ncbi:MvdC/MvdD family ATP grasp protein [Shewanella sp. CG12_big_fil_rev_8_21_14_0_65_47_15]|uniref:MvdC/MvdD family ATP grasp protein n=1 Tax=Shewanella sp. CG12_big_fil_rev_8_21_14_0_65_47_15 TaxID=1975537 RepID=UPI000CA6B0CB|nr:hypothetical protein [Shewanella sp. CG12_big_fil_rev_8_21_14_0_65_47_15]PIW61591.1 MAG: hypothetical protein COW15_07650 [Shewanella sp. CG12_big_fil_rev_8_21_14_0_65_47_15]
MNRKRILIVSNSDDLHVDVLTPLLTAKGDTPFRLDLDAFPRDYQFHQQIGQQGCEGFIQHLPTGDRLAIEDIGAVWLRKKGEFAFLSADLGLQEKAYAIEETDHTLFGLLYGLDCYWMSHPLAVRGASFKGEQMKRAVRLGFTIPPSIISNTPQAVKSFKQALEGDMVFKAMSSSFLAADKVSQAERESDGIPTTVISDEDMEQMDAVALVPCHFQGHIEKAYELRVTVIGERVFAAKIDSQLDERTKTDFRDFSVEIPYSAIELPQHIEQRCREFVKSYGLNYGALDLIVTPEDDYVFLENNPGGQFWFVEQLVPELTMMDALADCLIEGARC